MKILEYKYHPSKELYEFTWQEERSEKSEKTPDMPLPSFGEALENLKDIVIEACNLKPETELDILGVKIDPKRSNFLKFKVESYTDEGQLWKFTTRKISLSQLSDSDQESVVDFIRECGKFINGEREQSTL